MSESIPAGNDIPYVLNLQSSDVPRNECDEDFILFRVIRGSELLGAEFELFYGKQQLHP